MTENLEGQGLEEDLRLQLVKAAAADLRLLCRLNDREVDAALIADLKKRPCQEWFALQNDSIEMKSGVEVMAGALDGMFDPPSEAVMNDLAADFANIFITFGMRVAPNESYWLTEDHLERQEPMFNVRSWYQHYGLEASDWRKRPDDHIILEMQFVASLLESGVESAVQDAGHFMDEHLLVWSREFFGGIAARAATPFYAGLALMTEAQLQNIRELLVAITGQERATLTVEAATKKNATPQEPQMAAFAPGLEPSW